MLLALRAFAVTLFALVAVSADAQTTGVNVPSDCSLSSASCTQSGGTRVINGASEYQSCWGYHLAFNCGGPGYSDFCAGLEGDSNCQLQSGYPTCVTMGSDGVCNDYRSQYVCGDSHDQDPNVTLLNTSYTIIKDQLVDACTSEEQNTGCKLIGQTCTSPGGTHNINGLDVYKDCWAYSDDFECPNVSPVDNCSAYENAGCSLGGTPVCSATYSDGTCSQYTSSYTCDGQVSGAGSLSSTNTFESSDTIIDNCQSEKADPTCSTYQDTCVDGPSTKVINGVSVFETCWQWSRTYTCNNPNAVNTCTAYINAGCNETGSVCSKSFYNGSCETNTNTFECTSQVNGGGVQSSTDYIVTKNQVLDGCGAYENSNTCSQASEMCVDGPGTKIINGDPIYEDCWQWSYSYTCESATQNTDCPAVNSACVIQTQTCMSTDANGVCTDLQKVYSCGMNGAPNGDSPPTVQCGNTIYCLNGLCDQAPPRQQNQDFGKALTWLNLLKQFGQDINATTLQIFPGTEADCRKDLTGVLDCCSTDAGWSVSIGLGSCDSEEVQLWTEIKNKLTHYVGTYCSSSFLGVCLEHKDTYCSFNSMLARIIQEQGRPQLGIGWGPANNPNCVGLTIAQLQALDWSKINLSEFYPQIYQMTNYPNTVQTQTTLTNSITNFYSSGNPQ